MGKKITKFHFYSSIDNLLQLILNNSYSHLFWVLNISIFILFQNFKFLLIGEIDLYLSVFSKFENNRIKKCEFGFK